MQDTLWVISEFIDSHWAYLLIPVTSALIGWGTNWLAIKMTFYPLEFVGIPPFLGWQGIVPSKAAKMAGKSVDMLTSKLITIEEQFSRLSPDAIAKEMKPSLDLAARRIIDDIMAEQGPVIWASTPQIIKDQIYYSAAKDLPQEVESIMQDIRENIDHLFDLKAMVIKDLTENKKIMIDIFQECGKEEFKFIELSGLYFGFLLGLIQMVVWYFFPLWWILPLAGLIVGYVTNKAALTLIFNPIHPRRFLFWTLHGLFIKRQKEVAEKYAEIVASRVLTSKNIFKNMIEGPMAENLILLARRHVQEAVDKSAGFARSLIQWTQGTTGYRAIKRRVAKRFLKELPFSIQRIFKYTEEAFAMEDTLRERLSSLPPDEFVDLLRPVFQEDEYKLILLGAVLGMLAGCWQLMYLFGGSLF